MNAWIDITEFSAKYGVSTSTLRRRIRGQSIAYRLERGKYLLEDSEDTLKTAPLFARHTLSVKAPEVATREEKLHDPVANLLESDSVLPIHFKAELTALQQENRKLKAQAAEMQTLIQVLESELESH